MEYPAEEISSIIKVLCQGSTREQQTTIQKYFLPDAAFQHPLCRVPSMSWKRGELPLVGEINSRLFIMAIFRWYRLLSPNIELTIHSISFDEDAGILYVNLNQIFAAWFIPFYKADVHLITVLTLTTETSPTSLRRPGLQYSDVTAGKRLKYYIMKQEDCYQLNDVVNFFLPGLGPFLCRVGQHIGTIACVIGAIICEAFLWVFFGSKRAGWRGNGGP